MKITGNESGKKLSGLSITPINKWMKDFKKPLIISGPCSAESEDQVMNTAKEIAETKKVRIFRAGIWKPRTRPNSFEGVGEKGLGWMKKAKAETGLLTATEVANSGHVEMCLKHGIDILWIGARTTVNPFAVQEIADSLNGVDIPVMIKNPVNPDLSLWMGALERLNHAGITKLMAIHRGFSTFKKLPFRNAPRWEIPIELKTMCPEIDIICDPSHITGNCDLIPLVSQKGIDLDMAGLMIECHIQPKIALSDAKQQVTGSQLVDIIDNLIIREPAGINGNPNNHLKDLRRKIDELDDHIIQDLSTRLDIAGSIGEYKRGKRITILQTGRWEEIMRKRTAMGKAMGLSSEFMKNMLELIHNESIKKQTTVMNRNPSYDEIVVE